MEINITKPDAKILQFIADREGCILHPYQDSKGIYTIGLGSTLINGVKVNANTPPITLQQAFAYANDYLLDIRKWMQNNLQWQPNYNQTTSLYSFLYNTGIGSKFNSYVNTKQAIIDGDKPNIIKGMLSVNNKGLLTSRREQEIEMFNSLC